MGTSKKSGGSKYDENGFDMKTGKHRDTGTRYDPDGWDQFGWDEFGYHCSTGTRYDEDGYDENGFDRQGRHCDTGNYVDSEGYDATGHYFKYEQERQRAWERHQQGYGSKANWDHWVYGMDEDGNWIGDAREIAMVVTRGSRLHIQRAIDNVDLKQVQLAMDFFRGRRSKAQILVEEMKHIAKRRHDNTWSEAADVIGAMFIPGYKPVTKRRKKLRTFFGNRMTNRNATNPRVNWAGPNQGQRSRKYGPVHVRSYRRRAKHGGWTNVKGHNRKRAS